MSNENLVCPICGDATYLVGGKNPRKDKLCGKHSTMLFKKEIFFDESKKTYLDAKTNKQLNTEKLNNSKPEPNLEELLCIGCGAKTNGKHFCLKCYRQYRERTITIEVKGCTEFTITDAYGNRDTKTANGLYVRSLSEKIIYDELFRRGIKWESNVNTKEP